nr:uncharacterized protein LOC129265286 [Lytechinus pictus]
MSMTLKEAQAAARISMRYICQEIIGASTLKDNPPLCPLLTTYVTLPTNQPIGFSASSFLVYRPALAADDSIDKPQVVSKYPHHISLQRFMKHVGPYSEVGLIWERKGLSDRTTALILDTEDEADDQLETTLFYTLRAYS